MNVYYFSSCMEPVPFRFVPCVSVPRETPLRSHTHTVSISLALVAGKCWCGLFYSVLHSELQLNCYFITTFNKNQQVHESARKECPADCRQSMLCCPGFCLLLFALCPRRASSRPCCQRAQAAGAWANGAWFCGSIKFILSVGIKIKMLVICLGFLFTCCASRFFIAAEMATLEHKNWLRGQRGKLHGPSAPVRASNQA